MPSPEQKLAERNGRWYEIRLRLVAQSFTPKTESTQTVIFETNEELKMTFEENQQLNELVADYNSKESGRANLLQFILQQIVKKYSNFFPHEEKTQEPGIDSEQSPPEEVVEETDSIEKQYP